MTFAQIAAASLAAFTMCTMTYAAEEVVDKKLISKLSSHNSDMLQQWTKALSLEAEQLELKRRGLELAEQNLNDASENDWETVQRLTEKTGEVLTAGASLWSNYEALATLLATTEETSAWNRCLQSDSCSLTDYQTEVDETFLKSAKAAAEQAATMSYSLKEQATDLASITEDAAKARGINDLLSAIVKLNAQTSASLIRLNEQVSTLLAFTAANTAAAHFENEGQKQELTRFVSDSEPFKASHVTLRIGDYVSD